MSVEEETGLTGRTLGIYVHFVVDAIWNPTNDARDAGLKNVERGCPLVIQAMQLAPC
jgi:hypothetical protein